MSAPPGDKNPFDIIQSSPTPTNESSQGTESPLDHPPNPPNPVAVSTRRMEATDPNDTNSNVYFSYDPQDLIELVISIISTLTHYKSTEGQKRMPRIQKSGMLLLKKEDASHLDHSVEMKQMTDSSGNESYTYTSEHDDRKSRILLCLKVRKNDDPASLVSVVADPNRCQLSLNHVSKVTAAAIHTAILTHDRENERIFRFVTDLQECWMAHWPSQKERTRHLQRFLKSCFALSPKEWLEHKEFPNKVFEWYRLFLAATDGPQESKVGVEFRQMKSEFSQESLDHIMLAMNMQLLKSPPLTKAVYDTTQL